MTLPIAVPAAPIERARTTYFNVLVALTLASALATFVRDQDVLLTNVSFWFFASAFIVSIASTRAGLLATALVLTLSPALHQQLNALLGTKLGVWTYPGVDAGIGFIAAWTLKGGLKRVQPLLQAFPAGALLALHLWIACSAAVAIGRNLWQSASEFSWRGLASHAWLLRRIGLLNDYLPLQDLFYYTVAIALLFSACSVISGDGDRLVRRLAVAVLVGATANAAFAVWQAVTGRGWFLGPPGIEINALWPDLHSFGGFMAMAVVLGCGMAAARQLSSTPKVVVVLALVAASSGLYLSGSRSTLLIVFLVLAVAAVWAAMTLHGRWRAVPLSFLMALVGGFYWSFARGYRGVSFATLKSDLGPFDFKSVSVVLSHRPEIWAGALDMYSSFPLFGLGQGAFFRLSSIAPFSSSETLVRVGGSGAHNYFLQSFVELGPVALGIVLLVVLPLVRVGRRNFQLISFYALAGIAIGNVYAHSLLVREMLMLAAIFAGAYLWEAKTFASDRWQPLSDSNVRRASWALLALALAAFVEVALSFGRFPFTYGQRCFEERPLTWDHWTEGTLRVAVPPGASAVELILSADRSDLSRHPLDVAVAIVDHEGARILQRVEAFDRPDEGPHNLSLPIDASWGGKLFLEVKPSHCYVPLNVGRGHDGRHLGVRVQKLQFLPETS